MNCYFFRNRKGQMTPFFVILIAVLITAVMVTANIGKVGVYRVNTANAADSAALAAGTTLANALSQAQIASDELYYEFLLCIAIIGAAALSGNPLAWAVAVVYYIVWAIAQNLAFQNARNMVKQARFDAIDTARQLGFMNGGITEVKKREANEGYEKWQKRRSPFSQWLKKGKYKHEDTYSWDDEVKGAEKNSFSVKVITIPHYDLADWSIDHLIYGFIIVAGDKVMKSAPRLFLVFIDHVVLDGEPAYDFSGEDIAASVAKWVFGYGILGAVLPGEDDQHAPTGIKSTRFRPAHDLGLWKMRYGDKGYISSYSFSQVYGGCVRPTMFGGKPYDSKIIKVF